MRHRGLNYKTSHATKCERLGVFIPELHTLAANARLFVYNHWSILSLLISFVYRRTRRTIFTTILCTLIKVANCSGNSLITTTKQADPITPLAYQQRTCWATTEIISKREHKEMIGWFRGLSTKKWWYSNAGSSNWYLLATVEPW
jgi:hypothetical protein